MNQKSHQQIFFSYVAEDGHIVKELVSGLENESFITWTYETKSIPGPDYLKQIINAINESAIIVVIVSKLSIKSNQVKKEVQTASELDKDFIPVLVDITHEEFKQKEPEMAINMGEVKAIEVATFGDSSILSKIIKEIQFIMRRDKAIKTEHNCEYMITEKKSSSKQQYEIPLNITDSILFSVTAPLIMQPGKAYILDVWAHLEKQRVEVERRAKQSHGEEPLQIKTKGPVKVARDTRLIVRLNVDQLIIEDPEDTVLWDGEIGNANFAVAVPKDTPEGAYPGRATIHADGLLQIAKLNFVLQVGKESVTAEPIPVHEKRYSTAFASYSSTNREEVLSIIQGIQKGLPNLDIFLDVKSLRSGKYEKQLFEMIDTRDIFYLFWSKPASCSEWVEKEWRYAYSNRGLDYIDPVPLQPPEEAPPPKELADHLHFNHWTSIYKSYYRLKNK